MTGEAVWPAEGFNELLEAVLVETVLRVDPGDRSLDVQVGEDGRSCAGPMSLLVSVHASSVTPRLGSRRTTVARTGNENHLWLFAFNIAAAANEGLSVGVSERETASSAVVSEQATEIELFQLESPKNCGSQTKV